MQSGARGARAGSPVPIRGPADDCRLRSAASALRFAPGVVEGLSYYVYALSDPLGAGRVFYVRKGKGNRVYQHAIRAKRVDGESPDRLNLDRIRRSTLRVET
jgi:hypothetical protein